MFACDPNGASCRTVSEDHVDQSTCYLSIPLADNGALCGVQTPRRITDYDLPNKCMLMSLTHYLSLHAHPDYF